MKTVLTCGVALAVLWPGLGAAQDQRPRFGRDGQGPGRFSSSPQDMQSRLQRFDAFLKQFDVNGDGTIQPSEIPRERKTLFERMARRVGLDPNTPISVSQFRDVSMQHYAQRGANGGGGGRSFGGGPGGPPGSGPPGAFMPRGGPPGMPGAPGTPPAMGFGPTPTGSPASVPAVAGFGVPAAPAGTVPGSPAAAAVPNSAAPSTGVVSPTPAVVPLQPATMETQLKCQQYARSLMRQLDANHSGALEKEEWGKSRLDLKAADRNGDTAVSLEELTAWVVESAQKGVPGLNPSKFYRALTPTERLPDGLPEWFARKDADGDGQVSMAEYSNAWSDETVKEFSRYDLNNDGFITPGECLEAFKPRQP